MLQINLIFPPLEMPFKMAQKISKILQITRLTFFYTSMTMALLEIGPYLKATTFAVLLALDMIRKVISIKQVFATMSMPLPVERLDGNVPKRIELPVVPAL